jgi:hypothetical protein
MSLRAQQLIQSAGAPGQLELLPRIATEAMRVLVCEEFSRVPIFPLRPTGKPVVFHGMDAQLGAYTLYLGGVDKISPHDKGPDVCPSLCIDHAVLLLAHLHFYARRPEISLGSYSPSFRKIWAVSSGSKHPPSANQRAVFKRLMRDLDVCRFRVVQENGDQAVYNLIESEVEHVRRPGGSNLTGSRYANIRIHPLFLRTVLLSEITRDVDLHTLRSRTSRYSQTLYLWLPSRAAMNTEARPFAIGSEKLWEQMGLPNTTREERYDILRNTPMLRELDGVPLLDGDVMRVRIVSRPDDFILHAWRAGVAKRDDSARKINLDSILAKSFGRSGRPAAEYERAVRDRQPLDDYEVSLLQGAGVENLEQSAAFFEITRGLLKPSVFREIAAEAKNFRLEGGAAKVSFGARLRSALLNAIERSGPAGSV